MRLFVAIEIPEEIKEYISIVQENINSEKSKIRLVNTDNMHLTLKFLGEVQPDKLDEIKEKLKEVKFNKFLMYLDNIGVFPGENYIRVVWIGLKPENGILQLQKNIDDSLNKLFKKEKNFKAHITLARVKYIEDKKLFLENLKKMKIENKKIDVKDFRLIKSTLDRDGPVYENLEVFD